MTAEYMCMKKKECAAKRKMLGIMQLDAALVLLVSFPVFFSENTGRSFVENRDFDCLESLRLVVMKTLYAA